LRMVGDARYKRLHALAGRMAALVPQLAGLHPRAHRYVQPHVAATGDNRHVLDLAFLSTFADLPYSRQREIAERAGSTPDAVLEDLRQLEES
jgi:hypothetical protein